MVVDDGGTIETIAKTIPINFGKVEVKFYPEGGDLVAGVENRVYFTVAIRWASRCTSKGRFRRNGKEVASSRLLTKEWVHSGSRRAMAELQR